MLICEMDWLSCLCEGECENEMKSPVCTGYDSCPRNLPPVTQLFSLFKKSVSVSKPCLCLAGRKNGVSSRILGISGEGLPGAGPHRFLVIITNQHRAAETEQLPATSSSLGARRLFLGDCLGPGGPHARGRPTRKQWSRNHLVLLCKNPAEWE